MGVEEGVCSVFEKILMSLPRVRKMYILGSGIPGILAKVALLWQHT